LPFEHRAKAVTDGLAEQDLLEPERRMQELQLQEPGGRQSKLKV
jgi:hypothetical protein